MRFIIRPRRPGCQCPAAALLLACCLLAVATAAPAATPDAETAELWLDGGRAWQETALILRQAGADADGDRYRALLYAKQGLLAALQQADGLSAQQQTDARQRLLLVDSELEALAARGFLNLTAEELLAAGPDAARAALLAALSTDPLATRRALLGEWLRARRVWTGVAEVWAAGGDTRQQARVAATVADIGARIARLQEELDAAERLLAAAPAPRPAPAPPALPPLPLPEIRYTPAAEESAAAETVPAAAAERESRGIIDLEGPLESTLVVNGRKFIKLTMSATTYPDNPDETLSSTSFDIEQQLQVHITGTVGKTITVNVDYDDAKPEVERQTMSITYQSFDHQTPVGVFSANAAFGDIALNIPSTQFVSYNSSMFGVMGGIDLKEFNLLGMSADRLSFDAVITRAKGLPGRKVFYGAAASVLNSIRDVNYLARRYYRVTNDSGADAAPLQLGTLQVWRDDHNATTNDANTVLGMRVDNGADSYTGDFDLLQEGPDYTIDNLSGIVRFRSTIAGNHVIAVSYTTTAGYSSVRKLLRDENGSDSYDVYELRNRYDLGSLNIIADDPDFIFEIWGSDDKADTDTTGDGIRDRTWLDYFGLDRTGLPGNDGLLGTADDLPDGKIDHEWIDFEFGIVTFPDSEPFRRQNASVYGDNPQPRFTLHLEYKQKTQSYMLGTFNIIKGSDRVSISGREIGRDQYYIDYESGFLTFYNPDLITPNAEIVIDYQYLPFGGQFQQTAVAARTEAQINDHLLLGATVIRNWDAEPGSLPDVTSTPHANLVWDVNTVIDPLNVAVDAVNLFRTNELPAIDASVASMSITAEYAQSINDPNTYGSAKVDDIESLETVIGMPLSERAWRPATVPGEHLDADRGTVNLSEIEAGHDPSVDDAEEDALRVTYDFSAGDSWVAVRYPFSTVAKDLSSMLYLQLWARGAGTVRVTVDVGIVSEDINGDGAYQTEDANGDGKLNDGEDNGLDGIAGTGDYGEGNGYLDSEDMDGDNQLDTLEAYFRFGDVQLAADSYTVGEWTRYRVPLTRADTVGDASWEVVKHVRLRLALTGTLSGAFDFDQFEIVGNRWTDDDLNDSDFVIGAVNTKDDPNYSPPQEILDQMGISPGDFEQALSLTYRGLTDTGSASYILPEKQRYHQYRRLSYWLYGDNSNAVFFLRFGADAANYFEHQVTLDYTGWRQQVVDLTAVEAALIDLYRTTAAPFAATVGGMRYVGTPELETVKELCAGIYGNGSSGQVYLNQITVSEPVKQVGSVWATSFSSSFLNSLFTLGGSFSSRDNQFQLIGESTQSGEIEPRESRSRALNAGVALGRLLPDKWQVTAPLAVTWNSDRTDIDPVSVDNVRRNEVGFNRNENYGLSLSVSQPALPSVSFSHTQSDNENRNQAGSSEGNGRTTSLGLRYGAWPTLDLGRSRSLSRTVNTSQSLTSNRDDYTLTSSWNYTFPEKLFGVVPTGQTLSFSTNYGYSWNKARSEYLLPAQVPTYSNTRTDRGGLALTVQPVANFGLTPSFNYSRVYHWTQAERGMTSRARDASLGFNLTGAWGFSPTLSMRGNFNENFFAAAGTGWTKDLSTGGNFAFGLGMQPSAWWQKLSWLNIRYSYSNDVSATYRGVPVSTSLGEVYRDYFSRVYWFWAQQEPTVSGDALSLRRNSSSNTAQHALDGNLAFWGPLWLGYNFSYNRARAQAQNSISPTNSLSAGLNSRLNLKEAFPAFMAKRPANSLTANYTYKRIEQLTALTQSHTPSGAWSIKWSDNFNTNLNLSFGQTQVDDRELHTIDRTFTPSFSTSYFFTDPFRITNPVTGGGIEFQNQLRWDNTCGFGWQRKTGDLNSEIDKYNVTASTSLSYSLRSNISAALSGNFGYYVDNLQLNMNYYNYGGSLSAEIRF